LNATKTVSRTLTLNLPVEIYNSGNWDIIGATDAIVVSGALSSAAGQSSTITKAGLGTLTLSGNNASHSGGFNFQAGTLNVNHANALGTGAFIINGSGLKLNNSSGASVTINGVSGITLASDFTFTGSNDLNFGSAAVSLGANAGSTRSITVQDSNLVIGGIISNGTNGTTPTTGLVKSGAGKLTLSGANTFTGGVTISAGKVLVGNDGALGVGGTLTLANGVSLMSTNTTARALNNNYATTGAGVTLGDADNSGVLTLSGAGTLGGNLALTAASNVVLSGIIDDGGNTYSLTKLGSGDLTLSGANTFTGGLIINAGSVAVNGGAALANSLAVNIGASGTLSLLQSEGIGSVEGSGSLSLGANTLTIANGDNKSFSGVVTGTGGSITLSSGSLTLSGVNTYDGKTTLNGGTLLLGNDQAAGDSTIELNAGSKLSSASSAARTLANAMALSGALSLGDSTNNGALNISGSIVGSERELNSSKQCGAIWDNRRRWQCLLPHKARKRRPDPLGSEHVHRRCDHQCWKSTRWK